MFARFDENPAMTLRVIKETKRYGRTDGRTDGRTQGQRENSIPPTNKVCGGYNDQTYFSDTLTSARPLGGRKNPCILGSGLSTTLGDQQMLMHRKTCFIPI